MRRGATAWRLGRPSYVATNVASYVATNVASYVATNVARWQRKA